MENVLTAYKKNLKNKGSIDVMGVIRTLFADIPVETFIEKRTKKTSRKKKNGNN